MYLLKYSVNDTKKYFSKKRSNYLLKLNTPEIKYDYNINIRRLKLILLIQSISGQNPNVNGK